MTTPTNPGIFSRLVFILLSGFLGVAIGGLLGSLFVPKESGLAGGPMVLGYAVAGFALAILIGIILAKKLSAKQFKTGLLAAVVGVVPLYGWITYRFLVNLSGVSPDVSLPASPYQQPFEMHLRVTEAALDNPSYRLAFREIEISQDAAQKTFSWITAGSDAQVCRGNLEGLEAIDASEILQRVMWMAASGTRACLGDTATPILYRLRWKLSGKGHPMPEGEIAMTAECIAQEQSPRDLLAHLRSLYDRAAPVAQCQQWSAKRKSNSAFRSLFSTAFAAEPPQADTDQPLGIGIVKPRLVSGQSLYFYAYPDPGVLPDQLSPLDSMTLVKGAHFVDIATAPPWFVPEIMKLDYDILFLRATTISKDWVEVVVNKKTGLTSWVDRHAVDFVDWPRFLLDVYAIEIVDQKRNPVRVKPLDHASLVAKPGDPLHPIAVKGDWLMVSASENGQRSALTGWIRWREGERLLIRLVMLS